MREPDLGRNQRQRPTTPSPQRLPAITRTRFSLLRFRSPLLTESLLFSPQQVLRCFTSPPHHNPPIHSGRRDRSSKRPGYPIRKPWDHSPVGNSPRHIAASHVLHRSSGTKASTMRPTQLNKPTPKPSQHTQQRHRNQSRSAIAHARQPGPVSSGRT